MLCYVTLTPKILLPWYARKFSKFHSILRLVALVLRFLHNVRSRISDRKKGQLSLDELESAEIQLIRSVQAQSFTDEKLISNLSVFRDDNNIIRVKTRITERIDAPNFLSPILLPNNCIFTQRLVEHFHLKNHHAGTQLLLSIIREKYWLTGGRRTVRKIWNACVKCRRFKSKSPMSDPVSLPSDRVKDAAVFEVIVSSLSTDASLLSFRRFVVRRGIPRIIYSDNGTNFRGAYNKLIDIDWNEVSRYAEIQRITWKFIPPTAAWWGGFWERLVITVKELLKRTLGKAIFTYEELLTILCECEKFVNSRPLTYLSEDMQDLTPITPASFLFEIPTAEIKDLDFQDANHFRKRLRFRAKVIKELKKRFRNDYLGQLIQQQEQHPQSSNIQVGDIVLIGDDWKKILQWPLARVIKLIPGKDGLVRTVKLKTQSCTLTRPIQRVFQLEVSDNDITNPPLQKVQQTDSSLSCPNPDILKVTEKLQVTRCGRPLRKPDRLNLLTLSDAFD
ncbi:integrase catalytic domain-containing protein [Trichonephila clavipes]|nr:integrase catalytic domain-containing protein [Trichonephila clavipes]